MKATLTDYKNFWLIWINCAGKKKGVSLFQIQNKWGIKTNYLYHNESGLGKPLFRCMIEEEYLIKSGKYLRAKFDWIPKFIRKKYEPIEFLEKPDQWFPNKFINLKWDKVQKFMEKNNEKIFEEKRIGILYNNDKDIIGAEGPMIFSDIFLYIMFSNIMTFTKKYKADVVVRIVSTLISLSTRRNLLNYMFRLHNEMKNVITFPMIIMNENELSRALCTLKW